MAGLNESNKSIYQPIMNESNMENEKTPLYVAFSTPKRAGQAKPLLPCWWQITSITSKATMWRCSIVTTRNTPSPGCESGMPKQVGADEDYKRMAYKQFTRLGKKAYPVLCSSPEKAIATLTNIQPPNTCRIQCFSICPAR